MAWYVHFISNANRTLYIGIASDLVRRSIEHKNGTFKNSFTARYNFDRLVYFEERPSRSDAARREKQLKGWKRERKMALITGSNPDWRDLAPNIDDPFCVR